MGFANGLLNGIRPWLRVLKRDQPRHATRIKRLDTPLEAKPSVEAFLQEAKHGACHATTRISAGKMAL